MAEDTGDKDLPATQRKLDQAREEGDVWQSRDLTAVAVLLGAAVGIGGAGARAAPELLAAARRALGAAPAGAFAVADAPAFLARALAAGAAAALPLLACGFVAALLASRLQVGSVFAPKRLAPRLDHLNPVANLKNRVFSGRALLELTKSVVKAALVAGVAWSAVAGSLAALVRTYRRHPLDAAAAAGDAARGLALAGIAALAALAILDVLLQRMLWHKQQRMSQKERRDEHREQEGDPREKARLRRAREKLLRRMTARVREQPPDVAVRNPTHLVCLLRFDPERGGAPRLVAKGEGLLAEHLLELCAELGVPAQRDVPLARALFELELDTEIPAELYVAVSALLRWIAEEAEQRGELAPWQKRYEAWRSSA